MIHTQSSEGKTLIILEPRDIAVIKEGKFIGTPEGDISITFTPDVLWLAAMMSQAASGPQGISGGQLGELLREGLQRPEVLEADRQTSMTLSGMGKGVGNC